MIGFDQRFTNFCMHKLLCAFMNTTCPSMQITFTKKKFDKHGWTRSVCSRNLLTGEVILAGEGVFTVTRTWGLTVDTELCLLCSGPTAPFCKTNTGTSSGDSAAVNLPPLLLAAQVRSSSPGQAAAAVTNPSEHAACERSFWKTFSFLWRQRQECEEQGLAGYSEGGVGCDWLLGQSLAFFRRSRTELLGHRPTSECGWVLLYITVHEGTRAQRLQKQRHVEEEKHFIHWIQVHRNFDETFTTRVWWLTPGLSSFYLQHRRSWDVLQSVDHWRSALH